MSSTPATPPPPPGQPDRFEVSLELSKEMLKHTPEGTFVNIEDLRRAVKEHEEKVKPGTVKYTSFNMAKQAAMKDPELRAAFERQTNPTPNRREDVKP